LTGQQDIPAQSTDRADDIDGVATGKAFEQQCPLTNANRQAGRMVIMSRAPTHRAIWRPNSTEALHQIGSLGFEVMVLVGVETG